MMTEVSWHARVHALMPDLAIRSIEVNQEGLVNDVVIVNGTWVCRFAKTERGAGILETEAAVLDLVRPRLRVAVPEPVIRSPGAMVYPLLPGEPLLRDTLLRMAEEDRQALADQLGGFLHDLHAIPTSVIDLPTTLAPVTREAWVDIRARVGETVHPLLLPHQMRWLERLFEAPLNDPAFFDYAPVLIHGDLAPYHILVSPGQAGIVCEARVCGVLDFGVAGLGDPATDIGNLLTCYGESFASRMRDAYPDMDRTLPRARFYAQAIELQWVLLGLETGEDFWFTAHLGGARDIR